MSNEDHDKPICSFVMSKSQLAPMKEKTLTAPTLELQAAVLAIPQHMTVNK